MSSADRQELAKRYRARPLGLAGRIGAALLESKLTPLLIIASLLLGALAIRLTSSEEEPQIDVPMMDVLVGAPGLSADEMEYRVIGPLEHLLSEIEGVEYVYSIIGEARGLLILRYLVGTDPDLAALRTHAKIASAMDQMPPGVLPPVVKPRVIDDVPVAAWSLYSATLDRVALRRVAHELADELARHDDVARVDVLGGARRVVKVELDAQRLAAHGLQPSTVAHALAAIDRRRSVGELVADDRVLEVAVGAELDAIDRVGDVLLRAADGSLLRLGDVAEVIDGAEEATSFVWLLGGPAAASRGLDPELDREAVTVAVAKKPGANAVELVKDLNARLESMRTSSLPSDLEVLNVRDYGATAKHKSDELLKHLFGATLAVVLLMWITLSWREATVVLVVIPVTLALTLLGSYLYGYTLNRITLFALVFSIGILVDDAIVVVENVHRHLRMHWGQAKEMTIRAVDEVGNPTILATFAIVGALLPLAFVRGLMGPYMRPIPINASTAMVVSLIVAFTISPWLAFRLFRKEAEAVPDDEDDAAESTVRETGLLGRLYTALMRPLIAKRWASLAFLGVVVILLVAAMATVPLKLTTVKMLPHDDKSEIELILELPEGTAVERTSAVAREVATATRGIAEVTDLQVYVAEAAPINFNGLVRHYFLRTGSHQADIQVQLTGLEQRQRSSHEIAKAMRELIVPVAEAHGAVLRVAEIPPGPPVLSTLVAEIYGPSLEGRLAVARQVREIFETTPGVVDVDWEVEDPTQRRELVVNHDRAARLGLDQGRIGEELSIALSGREVASLHRPNQREGVPVEVRLRSEDRDLESLLDLQLLSSDGTGVRVGELVEPIDVAVQPSRHHKNLQPVTYVYGEVAGGQEAPVYAILQMNERLAEIVAPDGRSLEVISTHLPEDSSRYVLKHDGEWHITYEVFRDMGLAFAVVMVLIWILLVGWFGSFTTPLIIMVPIPLTLIGILPAHAAFGVFFTATSMIGFIALSGIIVRNSILLVDFIELELAEGATLADAVVRAGSIRLVPIVLTQASTIVGGSFMLSDPIFQGLALALISGIVVSTFLTLGVIPVLVYLSRSRPEVAR